MNPKLSSIDSKPAPRPQPATDPAATPPPPPAAGAKRIRRQSDPFQVLGPSPGFLLAHEDPLALQALRQSIQDRFGAKTPIDLFLAEFATATAWRGLRALHFESSTIDTEVFDQAAAVTRAHDDIDDVSRAALVYRDPDLARLLRHFDRSANECQRNLSRIFYSRAPKTAT